MIIVDLKQGSEEWKTHRNAGRNASEASIIMGCSKSTSRSEFLRLKATGDTKEYGRWVEEVLFARGHKIEAMARPIAEKIINEDLCPVIGVTDDYYLSASFDGLSVFGSISWECKQWNEEKAADVRNNIMPKEDYWQVVQQLIVSDAEKSLYMITDGTEEKTVFMWFELSADDRSKLIHGWNQWDEDVQNYQHIETPLEAVGRAPDELPALRIEVTGMVTSSNLQEFHAAALATFGSINRDLQTDQDFANAGKAIKFCADVEQKVEQAKKQALSQTESIEELFRVMDAVKAEARAVRIELENLDKKRKLDLRAEIQREGQIALQAHIDTIHARIAPIKLPPLSADFAGVIKGKKSFDSMRDAVSVETARCKIEASQLSELIGINLGEFNALASAHKSLFFDLQALVVKPSADFIAIVKSRIADHNAEEKTRIDAEVARKLEAEKPAIEPVVAETVAPAAEPAIRKIPVTINGKPATHEEVSVAAGLSRPSAQQIIFAVAEKFNVDFHTARGWIAALAQDIAA